MRTVSQNGRAALAYAKKLEWKVFPCERCGKRPLTNNGFKDATIDEISIMRWWTEFPNANIGVPTGRVNGFIAVDIDPRNNGSRSLDELLSKNGQFPNTIEAITGGGGRHILFKYPNINHIGNKIELFPGVDIKADGGYIVVAPSVHQSGECYKWELSSRPLEVLLADIPEWLLHVIIEPKLGNQKSINHWRVITQGVREGQRNQAVASLTGRMLSKGLDPIETAALIMAWNKCYNQPPLPEDEVLKTIDSIAKRELEKRSKREVYDESK